jgi:hypothetical protein
MNFVKDRNDLRISADKLYEYLICNNIEKQIFAKNLIKRGRNFVIHKVDTELRFYPSRFMGYKDNTQEKLLASFSSIRKAKRFFRKLLIGNNIEIPEEFQVIENN